jgi:hypothetical protein
MEEAERERAHLLKAGVLFASLVLAACPGGGDDSAIFDPCDASSIPCVPLDAARAVFTDDEPNSLLGEAIDIAGDVDHDGHSDLVMGAPFSSVVGDAAGLAWIVTNDVTGSNALSASLGATVSTQDDDGAKAGVGISVHGAGDANDDGYADVLVAAGGNHAAGQSGRIRILYGPVSGENWFGRTEPGVTGLSAMLATAPGCCLAPMTDVTGDGMADLVVGGPIDPTTEGSGGGVFVWAGPITTQITLADNVASRFGQASNDEAGQAIGTADLDGDGMGDLAVGAAHGGSANENGAVYIDFGPIAGSSGLAQADAVIEDVDGLSAYFGARLVSGTDADGDGRGDLWVAATSDTTGGGLKGAIYVFIGALAGTMRLADASAVLYATSIDSEGKHHGGTFASDFDAGDLDGDGFGDVVASTSSSAGLAAFALYGPFSGYVQADATGVAVALQTRNQNAGSTVALGGDVDGDGFGDALLGAPGGFVDDDGVLDTSRGAVYLISGASLAR